MSEPLTIREIANKFGWQDSTTVYKWIKRGFIPRTIYPHEIDALVARYKLPQGVTVTTAASRLGVTNAWVRYLIKSGHLTAVKVGLHPLQVTEESIDNYLKRRETK